MDEMTSYGVQNAAIDTFTMLWSIKKAMPDDVVNPVLEMEINKAIIKLETFGIDVEGLKFKY